MIRKSLLIACTLVLAAASAESAERYKVVRPVIIESGITGEWMMQLSGPVRAQVVRRVARQPVVEYRKVRRKGLFDVQPVEQVAYRPEKPAYDQIDPKYLPQVVEYETKYKPGTIVIDTTNRFLYLVMDGGKARRYGVGVGKPGFEWAGEHKVTR